MIKKCISPLLLLASGSCMTDALAQGSDAYTCASTDAVKVSCGPSGDYVGKISASAGTASFDIKRVASVQSATVYNVSVKGSDKWCFDISGDKTKVHGFNEAPILAGPTSSLFVLAGISQRVLSNRAGAALEICNAPINNLNTSTSNLNEFYLLVGNPQDITYLAQTPSVWMPDPNAVVQKVIDKTSPIVKRDSYLFVDLTESNAPQLLNLAQQGAFPYVLITATTWAKTLGSYPINNTNYPHGIDGLIAVSKQASQRNIKIGLHTLTALVSKGDPLAAASHGLLKKDNALVVANGCYLLDLKSDLKNFVAARVADVVNKVNPGMIYFDGGELSAVAGDPTYDIAEQQINVLGRLKNRLLVQGSGDVPRLWPYLSRIAMDDYATLASTQYLDSYKIAQILPMRTSNLMPAELGWIGLVAETPAHPATTVEDMSTYLARALALDLPFSIETVQTDLDGNPYTARLFRVMGAANRTLQSGSLDTAAKKYLQTGNWYLVDGTKPYLAQLSLQKQHIVSGQDLIHLGVTEKNASGAMLRISNVHQMGNQNVIPLLPSTASLSMVKQKNIDNNNRGLLINTQHFTSSKNGIIDLTHARQMSVDYSVRPEDVNSSAVCSVINAQLEDVNGFYRDYYLKVIPNHAGLTLISYLDAPAQMLSTLMPAYSSYRAKAAIRNFDFSKVTAINFRWMKTCDSDQGLVLKNVSMLQEVPTSLNTIQLLVGNTPVLNIPALQTGEVLDVFPDGAVTICKQGVCKQVRNIASSLANIANQSLYIKTQGNAAYDLDFGELTTKVQL
jgi:hypothetical protein